MIELPTLAEAARAERDRRAERYPQRSADGKISADDATIDYQCWVAIAEWLESGRFMGFYGGASPEESDAPWIGWPQLDQAAAKALTSIDAKIERLAADPDQERVAALNLRRANLTAIHRKVQLRRQMVDSINHELRERRAASVGQDGAAPQENLAA